MMLNMEEDISIVLVTQNKSFLPLLNINKWVHYGLLVEKTDFLQEFKGSQFITSCHVPENVQLDTMHQVV